MNKPKSKLVGLFVVGAGLLVAGAIVLYASQDLFVKKRHFVAYFEQSVNGLNKGAAVRFRGIPVGEVIAIDGVFDPKSSSVKPRLIIQFLPETLKNAAVEKGEYTLFQPLVDRGMRASLKSQSFLTGQLYVSLDFHPDKPVRLLGNEDDPYPEMPTIDSGLDRIFNKIENLPIESVLNQLGSALAAAEDLLRKPSLHETIDGLPSLVAHTDETIVDADTLLKEDLTGAVREARSLMATGTVSLGTLTEQLSSKTLVSAERAMAALEKTLDRAHERLSVDDPLSYELIVTLRELGASANSLRQLLEYLQEHPEALVQGKTK